MKEKTTKRLDDKMKKKISGQGGRGRERCNYVDEGRMGPGEGVYCNNKRGNKRRRLLNRSFCLSSSVNSDNKCYSLNGFRCREGAGGHLMQRVLS